jgi:RNA polymerase sigma-70 factor (ECF subfamily)
MSSTGAARNNCRTDETIFLPDERQRKRLLCIHAANKKTISGVALWGDRSMQSDYALTGATRTLASTAIHAIPDVHLLRDIARGDKRAMQVLFARHNVRVYRFIARMVGDGATAEDLVSEVFLDVWRKADQFEGRSQVSTWLLAIARFKALSHLRSRTTDYLDDEAALAVEDPADNPEVALEKRDRGALLRKCLTQLSAGHREVIDLVYYHERSMEEVAQILRIPEATVRTRMFYARKRMAELLKAEGLDHAMH